MFLMVQTVSNNWDQRDNKDLCIIFKYNIIDKNIFKSLYSNIITNLINFYSHINLLKLKKFFFINLYFVNYLTPIYYYIDIIYIYYYYIVDFSSFVGFNWTQYFSKWL